MGTDDALVAVLADHPGKRPDHARTLQTTPATARDTPETANLETRRCHTAQTLPVAGRGPAIARSGPAGSLLHAVDSDVRRRVDGVVDEGHVAAFDADCGGGPQDRFSQRALARSAARQKKPDSRASPAPTVLRTRAADPIACQTPSGLTSNAPSAPRLTTTRPALRASIIRAPATASLMFVIA